MLSQLAALGEGVESLLEEMLCGFQDRVDARLEEAAGALQGRAWPPGSTAAAFVRQLGERMVADTEQMAQVCC